MAEELRELARGSVVSLLTCKDYRKRNSATAYIYQVTGRIQLWCVCSKPELDYANETRTSSQREAYNLPTVDSSDEPFHWGFPDLIGLRG